VQAKTIEWNLKRIGIGISLQWCGTQKTSPIMSIVDSTEWVSPRNLGDGAVTWDIRFLRQRLDLCVQ
jgi:hypothetical protein